MKKLLQSKRSGSAIPLAVVAMLILLAMGVGLLSLGFNSRVYTLRNASGIKARCAADAGLEMALFEMNKKLQVKPFNEGTLPKAIDVDLPYTDQVCSYHVTKNFAGSYVITSLGQSGEAQRAVRATIGLQSPFNNAILVKESLTLKSGTVVDGYNSDDLTETDIELSIGSQSTAKDSITLNSGATVNGDVFVAPGADIDTAIKDLGATIKGDKHTGEQIALPKVTAPTLPNMGTDISAKAKTVTITPADNGVYTAIDLASTGPKLGVLEISGGDVVLHVTGDILLGQGCEIVVKDDATLKIYSDGDIVCGNGSSINTEAPPEEAATLQLFATGTGTQFFDVKAKSEWTGTIYAPDADVVLYAGGDVYGSVVAHDFDFKAGGNFNYDKALQKKNTVDDDAVVFVVTRWYESAPLFSPDLKLAEIEPMLEMELVK
ncbi:MAG: collagen-binding domain-containing protein [Sedimentisphaerales bacterium]